MTIAIGAIPGGRIVPPALIPIDRSVETDASRRDKLESVRQDGPMVHASPDARSRYWWTGLAVVLVAGSLLTYGGAGSYESLSHLAATHAVPLPQFAPAGLDGGLAGSILLEILFALLGRPVVHLRLATRFFALGSIAFNCWAGWPDPVGVTMRVFAPALILVITEAVRHAIRWEEQYDSIPTWRWVLALRQTFRIWKRMKLWGIRSYTEAIELELNVRHSITRLRQHYGKVDWRMAAPDELVWMLDHGVRIEQALAMVADITKPRLEVAPLQPRTAPATKTSVKKRQGPASGRGRKLDWDTEAAALSILVRDPAISGSQLGREIGVDPSYGRVLRKKLMAQVLADSGQLPAVSG